MQTNEQLIKTSVDQPARSCAFNEDGSHLAVGLVDGSFIVLLTKYSAALLKL